MKKLVLSMVALMVAAASFAQSSLLATLSHNGEIKTFYGASALKDAHAAAEHGDVITLSSGTFLAVDITKAVTIHGAGMEINQAQQAEPTVITGDFKINIADSIAERLTIEGIYSNHTICYVGTLKNATFIKDRLRVIKSSSTDYLKNAAFIHCKIAQRLYLDSNCSASCVNCVIWGANGFDSVTSNFDFLNCIVCGEIKDFKSSSFKNSILISTSSTYNSVVHSSCTAYNNVGIGIGGLFQYVTNTSNVVTDYGNVFKTHNGTTYSDGEAFELTDAAKERFLGMDGTQVGIYGGSMPFSSVPTNPQITKCNVAAKSTADGKLSVDITVGVVE